LKLENDPNSGSIQDQILVMNCNPETLKIYAIKFHSKNWLTSLNIEARLSSSDILRAKKVPLGVTESPKQLESQPTKDHGEWLFLESV
jgi:hypothetical protein